MKVKIELTIIIVEYKSGRYLTSLLKMIPKRIDWEVIVIDNSIENRGYGGGLNLGAQKAHGEYLLFLNPDVQISGKCISTLMRYLKKHKNVGVVGPKYINDQQMTEQCSTQFPSLLSSIITFSPLNTLFPNNSISQHYLMKDWDRESTRIVNVISGAAMMVRAAEFERLGKFDDNMFLYWEEFDLCARYKKTLGLHAAYVSEAVAHHPREVSMRQSENDLHTYFVESRRIYLKKQLGLVAMLLIEFWLGLCEQWRYVVVGVLALFLRVWNIQNIQFIGDLGRDYLEAVKMIGLKIFPLMGIPSSIPRFMQGPFNVWFDAFSFLFGGINPFSPVLFSALLTTIGVLLLMKLATQHYGKHAGFITGLLSASMMSGVLQSRMPFHLFAIPLFLTVHIFFIMKEQITWRAIFLSTLTFWLTFQWEIALLPLLIPLVIVITQSKVQWKQKALAFISASIFGLLPQLLFDLTHKCTQLCGLGVWAVYRVIAFSGFDGKHGVATLSFTEVFQNISFQLHQLMGAGIWSGAILLALIICTALYLHKKHDLLAQYVSISTICVLAAIIIHGSPSEAYFPPFLVFIPLFIAFFISRFSIKQQKLLVICVIFLAALYSSTLLSHQFYAKPLRYMLDAAQWISQDAEGKPVTLVSYDDPAHQDTYLNHVKFLVQMYGGILAENGTPYIIALDERVGLPTINILQQQYGYIRVVKKLSDR